MDTQSHPCCLQSLHHMSTGVVHSAHHRFTSECRSPRWSLHSTVEFDLALCPVGIAGSCSERIQTNEYSTRTDDLSETHQSGNVLVGDEQQLFDDLHSSVDRQCDRSSTRASYHLSRFEIREYPRVEHATAAFTVQRTSFGEIVRFQHQSNPIAHR